jgi:hypothetical protein
LMLQTNAGRLTWASATADAPQKRLQIYHPAWADANPHVCMQESQPLEAKRI